MGKKKKQELVYCKKHDQHFSATLKSCPICHGEYLGKENRKKDLRIRTGQKT